jgi:hypothetical protein
VTYKYWGFGLDFGFIGQPLLKMLDCNSQWCCCQFSITVYVALLLFHILSAVHYTHCVLLVYCPSPVLWYQLHTCIPSPQPQLLTVGSPYWAASYCFLLSCLELSSIFNVLDVCPTTATVLELCRITDWLLPLPAFHWASVVLLRLCVTMLNLG